MESSKGIGCLPVKFMAGHCAGLAGGDAQSGEKPIGIVMPSGIEAMVCADVAQRQAKGVAKYGTTVADNPLVLRQWLQHQYEELLDAAVYCRRAIAEIDAQANEDDGDMAMASTVKTAAEWHGCGNVGAGA